MQPQLDHVVVVLESMPLKKVVLLQVCAPTGAGKTNIAMIAVLHEVHNQRLNHSFFKFDLFLFNYARMLAFFFLSRSIQYKFGLT